MQLLVPHIDVFPLFTPIPYSIVVTTCTPPIKLKGGADEFLVPEPNEKELYPPLMRDPSFIHLELRRFVDMKVAFKPSNPEEHITDVIATTASGTGSAFPVEMEIGERTWVPDEENEGRGQWMQEATFHSRMYLRYTPTFVTEEVKIKVRYSLVSVGILGPSVLTVIKYTLSLKVEFPGQGSILRLELPISIGSGVQSSVPLSGEVNPASPRMIDLPQ